ncbi:reverse transcriptase domain-containing protein [Tanacetum coccineum]
MAKEDEEKTTFITSQGIFCYSKMPFDLKNVGATYQRLVDNAFQKQTGRNLEVCVDDLVIKSHTEHELIRAIQNSKEIHMKLNPKKCTFRIEEGMFLGYKVNTKGIKYRPRTSVKGKILADFIVERSEDDSPDTAMKVEEELPDPWTLFTDGSSCVDGSGAGLILTDPKGTEFTYALRFRFEVTNNEAEYEALIVGLKIAEQMGVKNLQVSMDSRLVSNQVLVEELSEKSINVAEVLIVVEEEGDTWVSPIYKYLTEETLPAEKEKHARRNKICGSEGNTDRVLLAHNACGCKKTNPGMSGSPPRTEKPSTKADSHHVPVAIL